MTETCFRITSQQFLDIGSLLAANVKKPFVLFECGNSVLATPFKRTLWTIKKLIGAHCYEDMIAWVSGNAGFYGVITTPHHLVKMPLGQAQLLVGVLQNGSDDFSVYHTVNNELALVDSVAVIGADFRYQFCKQPLGLPESQERTAQAFGKKTTDTLRHLTIGIAGASGTGSVVAEQLVRLGVGRLILVDDDVVEPCNLNRILNSTAQDAKNNVKKVSMLKHSYEMGGFRTEVIAIDTIILNCDTIKALAQCDIIFGCLDSVDGRVQLNRISTFYTIPYIDLACRL